MTDLGLITTVTDAVRFSKQDFADTIKIKVIDGAVVGRLLHFPKIQIDKLSVGNLYITTTNFHSIVGSALLKHVSLIIDAPRKQFVFVARSSAFLTERKRKSC